MALKNLKLVNRKDLSEVPIPPEGGVIGKNGFAGDYFSRSRFMSREHLFIYRRDGEYYVVDRNSRNGCVLNKQPLIKGREYLISVGDVINIANMVFTVALDRGAVREICLTLSAEDRQKYVAWCAEAIECIHRARVVLADGEYAECRDECGRAVFLASRVIINILGQDREDYDAVMQCMFELLAQEKIDQDLYRTVYFFMKQAKYPLKPKSGEHEEAFNSFKTALAFLAVVREVLFNPDQSYLKLQP